jgi:hypothetical protein
MAFALITATTRANRLIGGELDSSLRDLSAGARKSAPPRADLLQLHRC